MTETAADEQDLAQALDGVANATNASLDGTSTTGINLPPIVSAESSTDPVVQSVTSYPTITPVRDGSDSTRRNDDPTRAFTPQPHVAEPPALTPPPVQIVDPTPVTDTSLPTPSADPLADIKQSALKELRPLVDKLSVSAEEKFDTYLLLIRSTDDANLIGPAHDAAVAIPDEARRAEALLDIIKEIDYLSRQDKPAN